MPDFIIEDARALWLPDDHDRATELEVLGNSYTYRDLYEWRDRNAHLFRYEDGKRSYVGSVDGILSGRVRPPLEVRRSATEGEEA